MVPLEMMPDRLAAALGLLPLAPAVEMIRSGYLGYDLVNGVDEASAITGPALWTAAFPSVGLLLAWLALSVYLLRYFRWDPRQEQ
ncbi:hypothetical protein [Allosalinactinospora lopnorensis]|uniref:hypothetical protein n=1 Tax=Allosalinactinospora lopnorensis TaxID=1352348 RepID=UPI000697F93C|nr:hypothetical protein [Allosalinactinospora lopnorensis]